jgi:hypothetical protein
VYYLHDPPKAIFLEWLRKFLQVTREYFTVYFSGHGGQVSDLNGDEDDGMDEAMVFPDGYIIDDDLSLILRRNCSGITRVLLLTDCCHSGTIWDIPEDVKIAMQMFPANILSISSSSDSQLSKQASGVGGVQGDQGLFTYFMFTALRDNRNLTPTQLFTKLDPVLRKFEQTMSFQATRPELIEMPIVPQV